MQNIQKGKRNSIPRKVFELIGSHKTEPYQTFRFLSARWLPLSETRGPFPARLDPVGPLTRGIMIRDYVTNYDEPAVKSKTAARSSWIMSLVERNRGGEVHRSRPGWTRALRGEDSTLAPGWISPLCLPLSGSTAFGAVYARNVYTYTRQHGRPSDRGLPGVLRLEVGRWINPW